MTNRRPTTPTGGTPAWRTSSRSQTANCVEVALETVPSAPVAVRDSKDRGGPVLTFDAERWSGFISAAKAGEFDRG
ncbi:DUF397 domain-containing protein [Polymorphospora rubra]|uniref:DUF397 domain-containing protein n=1 Tax=Polymorphospora rubra TaxID=338584 RepID=A0A810N438_9ACTN|nr:DUF397 domain-containing protein [Polymorphospora rubra]BCJ66488.1 hypothetical protein Prubr_35090 [Polymorphospora rubra]